MDLIGHSAYHANSLYLVPEHFPVLLPGQLVIEGSLAGGRLPVGLILLKELAFMETFAVLLGKQSMHVLDRYTVVY